MKFFGAPSSLLRKHGLALAVVLGFPIYATMSPFGGNGRTCSPLLSGVPLFPIGSAQAAPLAANSEAPAWDLKDLAGKSVTSKDFAGKVVMLNFWGTWCPPCVAEIPELIELQKTFADRGFSVVGAAFEPSGRPIDDFVKKAGINYPIVTATDQVRADFGGVNLFPTTFFIDREGKIARVVTGPMSAAQFGEIIEPLL